MVQQTHQRETRICKLITLATKPKARQNRSQASVSRSSKWRSKTVTENAKLLYLLGRHSHRQRHVSRRAYNPVMTHQPNMKRSLTMGNFTITHDATDFDIRVAFIISPYTTIAELARRSGKTVPEVKKILMGDYV